MKTLVGIAALALLLTICACGVPAHNDRQCTDEGCWTDLDYQYLDLACDDDPASPAPSCNPVSMTDSITDSGV